MAQLTREAEDDGFLSPYRIKVRDKTKYLSDHLGPLRRLLRSQLGQPWDQVYSKIRREVKGNTMAGQHVLEHVSAYVCTAVEMVDGQPYAKGGVPWHWGNARLGRWRNEFYVHPETGLLCLADVERKAQKVKQASDFVVVSDLFQYRLIDGIWYGIEFEAIAQCSKAYDLLLKQEISCLEARQFYGSCIVSRQKRQCNKKTLKWIRSRLKDGVNHKSQRGGKQKGRGSCLSLFYGYWVWILFTAVLLQKE